MGLPSDPSSDRPASPPRAAGYARSEFMAVKIPVVGDVDDQWHQREDRIDEALRAKGLGSVLGWGDSLGEALPGGALRVAFTRVDLDVSNIAAARAALQLALPAIGLPLGTEIHYAIDGSRLADIYGPSGWLLGQPTVDGPPRPPARRAS